MHIDRGAPIALFLFPHQDDEFGVFFQIEKERKLGRRICCVYVTDGSTTADPMCRNAESKAVLQQLGVDPADIWFTGQQLQIADGALHAHVERLAEWMDEFINSHPEIVSCYVPAWEGGHPDHDLLYAITVLLPALRDRLDMVRQFALYHGQECFGPFFRVLSPIPVNGPVERQAVGWRTRMRYVRLCLAYPSQWRSWVGLFPFVCLRYLYDGAQQLQRVDSSVLSTPPHSGSLYYERRAFLDWPTLSDAVKRVKRRFTDVPGASPNICSE
ncbi:PIG-L deacetylase family protein [Duganella sp. Root198D2]|uniref:PIG-L deacetylase family protein n=1 Tax=Duganella sp. Root198D2 TaxID=1736489 RepID=UPI0009E952CC|nr:PIG-L family deacetylase [Duganella sp. Root198D2]